MLIYTLLRVDFPHYAVMDLDTQANTTTAVTSSSTSPTHTTSAPTLTTATTSMPTTATSSSNVYREKYQELYKQKVLEITRLKHNLNLQHNSYEYMFNNMHDNPFTPLPLPPIGYPYGTGWPGTGQGSELWEPPHLSDGSSGGSSNLSLPFDMPFQY